MVLEDVVARLLCAEQLLDEVAHCGAFQPEHLHGLDARERQLLHAVLVARVLVTVEHGLPRLCNHKSQ